MRDWLVGATEGELIGYELSKAMGKYLDSRRVEQALVKCFGPGGNRIHARTARGWMKTMGFSYEVKGVYVDGREREDVVRSRFKEQNGRLQEELECRGQLVILPQVPL